ncbi:hypothetical protein PVAND_000275 [Polypedilum vanderplanki]|uniref:Uncharacterized protein n=1 Tax=Polypedilum vanderplanki TaxID=319348 RepID=A0A9J6BKG3_POLVA|nr:hypothetical protein PVAND_000275 [Polypedilum vanderplanki]
MHKPNHSFVLLAIVMFFYMAILIKWISIRCRQYSIDNEQESHNQQHPIVIVIENNLNANESNSLIPKTMPQLDEPPPNYEEYLEKLKSNT